MKKYRIVADAYSGYEVQCLRWYWPFWTQCGFTNTHSSVEAAERYAKMHADSTIKSLGWL